MFQTGANGKGFVRQNKMIRQWVARHLNIFYFYRLCRRGKRSMFCLTDQIFVCKNQSFCLADQIFCLAEQYICLTDQDILSGEWHVKMLRQG